MATLAIVGAMAVAAMAPATVFASPADNQTTVGYVPGGTPITDINAIVVVPKDTMFKTNGGTIENFNVEAKVLNADGTKYIPVDSSNHIEKDITVKVQSKNKGKLVAADSTADVSYTYTNVTNSSTSVTLTGADPVELDVIEATSDSGIIEGKLTMNKATFTEADHGQAFVDTLTYTFSTNEGTYPTE